MHKICVDNLAFVVFIVLYFCLCVRDTMSEEKIFVTVSMAPFRSNRQALHGIFQYVLTITKPPQKLKFSSSTHMHTVSS